MAVLTDYIIAKRATMHPSATTKAPAIAVSFGSSILSNFVQAFFDRLVLSQ